MGPAARAGVTHLYNSRSVDFAAEILADTNGQGVDLILNSLTGAGYIEADLAALAPGGYLIEMSKRDVWGHDQIAAVRPDARYSLIDLIAVGNQQPALLQTMLAQIIALYAERKLVPLPCTAFPIDRAIDAFRYMQQARHVGKIVLIPPSAEEPVIKEWGTYLITGGLGGLGLAVAHWLVGQGARHLTFIGRSKPKVEAQLELDAMVASGVELTLVYADVADPVQLQAAVQQIDSAHPLRGIVHAAGVLDDSALANQGWERFTKVLRPKVQGAWNLHLWTRTMPLDFFVVFASTAGVLGNRGQASHAAANAFLDAFVHYRRAQGLPALSIDWGPWARSGQRQSWCAHSTRRCWRKVWAQSSLSTGLVFLVVYWSKQSGKALTGKQWHRSASFRSIGRNICNIDQHRVRSLLSSARQR